MKNEIYYIELLQKKYLNEISPEESSELEEWINFSDENKHKAIDFQLVWNDTEQIPKELFSINVDKEFESFKKNIKPQTKIVSFRKIMYLTSAAAAVVLLFFVIKSILKPDIYYYSSENQIVQIILPDSSVVMLAPDSKLVYTDSKLNSDRHTELTGDAFFSVTHDPEHPFIVESGNIEISVKGTEFLVSQTQNKVVVRNGKVLVSKENDTVYLTANQETTTNIDKLVKSEIGSSSLNLYFNELKLTNKTIGEVVDLLQTVYNQQIVISDNTIKNKQISFTITKDENLDSVIKVIELTLDLKFVSKQGIYYIEKK